MYYTHTLISAFQRAARRVWKESPFRDDRGRLRSKEEILLRVRIGLAYEKSIRERKELKQD